MFPADPQIVAFLLLEQARKTRQELLCAIWEARQERATARRLREEGRRILQTNSPPLES